MDGAQLVLVGTAGRGRVGGGPGHGGRFWGAMMSLQRAAIVLVAVVASACGGWLFGSREEPKRVSL